MLASDCAKSIDQLTDPSSSSFSAIPRYIHRNHALCIRECVQGRDSSRPEWSASKISSKHVRTKPLGKSSLLVSEMGCGAWSWGDKSGYWKNWDKSSCEQAFKTAVDTGLTFIDTAEVYGFGQSERFLGEFIKSYGPGASSPSPSPSVQVATKYAPLPWRQSASSVVSALDASLERLDRKSVSLYIQHWPGFFLNAFSNQATLEGLQMCLESGKTEAVGVSNFNARRVREAARYFEGKGGCLSSNQVQYSLLYREPERNGVMEACREYGVSVVAYSPLCQGMLTGKYSKDRIPEGPRGMYFKEARFAEVGVLLDLLGAVSKEIGKSPTQISLKWLMQKDDLIVPIPGVRNAQQVEEVAGACGDWRLSEGVMAELDAVSARIPSSTGAPFEKW